MDMINIWKTVVLQRYAKFDGRAGRAEFWWFVAGEHSSSTSCSRS